MSNSFLESDCITMGQQELAKSLNEFYISVNADISLLNVNVLPAFLHPTKDEGVT